MDRIVVVTKPTRLDELVREYHTEGAARFALESKGQSIEEPLREHAAHAAALAQVRQQLPGDIHVAFASRSELPHFLFREKDLIVAVGPDGLFCNLAQYVGDQLVLAVNPDPVTVPGVLMLWKPAEVGRVISATAAGKHKVESLPLAKAELDDGRVVWGLNEIFIGRRDQGSARYEIEFDGRRERQSSSGIVASTGVGAFAWMRSIKTMIEGLVEGSVSHALLAMPKPSEEEMVFVVREAFPLPGLGTSLVTGRITPENTLVVRSEMPKGGYLLSDGILERAVEWSAGSSVTVSVGERCVQRIVR